MTDSDIIDSLSKVSDPEIGLNIVDVGLIYHVKVKSDTSVEVEYTLTTPGCPLADVIENDIRSILKEDWNIEEVALKLVWTPPWSIDFMSESARLELGYPI